MTKETKRGRGRPRLPESQKKSYSRIVFSIPDYLFDKLEYLSNNSDNMSREIVNACEFWLQTSEDLVDKLNIKSQSGKYFTTKAFYFGEKQFLYDGVLDKLSKLNSIGYKLKAVDIIINVAYWLKKRGNIG